MLDGRVLGASQVEYKPFGKPPLKRELSGRIESIWETPSKERGEAHGIGACLESGRNTERACNMAARSCPSSLSKFPGRTWTSGSARGKYVIKLVQVPCPSSCPSSGFRPGPRSWNRGPWNRGVILRELVTRQPAVVQVPCPSSQGELGQVAL